jgi:superoxide dismutase, Cu-Zn family
MSPRRVLPGVLGVLLLAGCAVNAAQPTASSQSNVQLTETFQSGTGTAITYNEGIVPAGARAAVQAQSSEGTTTVRLAARSLEPHRLYGAHVHSEPCGARPEDSGPHFQFSVDPVQPSVDPEYANPRNEIWLDFTTDEIGAGSAESTVDWTFPVDRRPRSVVVHSLRTSTEPGEAGDAGDRAACISVDF